MGYVDSVLMDFKGQLRYDEILHMTYKEIGYLKEHRIEYYKNRQNKSSMGEALEELNNL